jgi:hypothetical protein
VVLILHSPAQLEASEPNPARGCLFLLHSIPGDHGLKGAQTLNSHSLLVNQLPPLHPLVSGPS